MFAFIVEGTPLPPAAMPVAPPAPPTIPETPAPVWTPPKPLLPLLPLLPLVPPPPPLLVAVIQRCAGARGRECGHSRPGAA